MSNELVTIIIPVYNHEEYVKDAIKSAILQTYPNIELIIINDGSTDNSVEKILELKSECEKRFIRFEFINKKNEGKVSVQNLGIEMSKGEYIYIIDSDDIAKPNAVEILYNFINNKDEYGLVVGDNEFIDIYNNKFYWDENRQPTTDLSNTRWKTFAEFLQNSRLDVNFNSDEFGTYKSLLYGNYIPGGWLARKKALINTNECKNNFLDDWYLHLQISKKYKMKFINEVLFSYRQHYSNITKQVGTMRFFAAMAAINELKFCGDEHKEIIFNHIRNHFHYLFYTNGNLDEDMRDLLSKTPASMLVDFTLFLSNELSNTRNELYNLSMKQQSISEIEKSATVCKIGRNDPCICGSGKKYKKCCLK